MARAAKGTCTRCRRALTGGGMSRHLRSCWGPGDHVLLQVKNRGGGPWWLYLAAGPGSSIRDLDRLLRDHWLECCGHLSALEVGELRFQSRLFDAPWGEPPQSMDARIVDVIPPKVPSHYRYDFGSPTDLVIRNMGTLHGEGPGLTLLAENDEVAWPCDHCGDPATEICPWCFTLTCGCADACSERCHGAYQEALLPVVNSPRMGVCGFAG